MDDCTPIDLVLLRDDLWIDEIVEIERASFPRPWSRANLLASVAAEELWGIFGGAQLLGYLAVSPAEPGVYLQNLAIVPKFRRRGYANNALQNALTKWGEMVLDVRRSNRAAIDLYESLGGIKIAEISGYYGDEDGVRYRLVSVPNK